MWQNANGIYLITGTTGEIDSDPSLFEAQRIYFELRAALEERYGPCVLNQNLIESDEAWLSLITGDEQRISTWTGGSKPLPEGIMLILLAIQPHAEARAEVTLTYHLGGQCADASTHDMF